MVNHEKAMANTKQWGQVLTSFFFAHISTTKCGGKKVNGAGQYQDFVY